MAKPFTLQFDGGSRGNPGPAGAGVVLLKDGEPVFAAGQYVGNCTNNVAEYRALVYGLERALAMGIKSLEVRGDSELVIRQMLGVYRVKHPDLQVLHGRAGELAKQIGDVVFVHNLRHHNTLADELANRAMDARREVLHIPGGAAPTPPMSSPQVRQTVEPFQSSSETDPCLFGGLPPAVRSWLCPACGCKVQVVKPSARPRRGPLLCTCGTEMQES